MSFVGIDQSYSGFGITFLKADGTHETLVKKFDPSKYGPGPSRLQVIADWLGRVLAEHDVLSDVLDSDIEHVCMEGYASGAKFGREKAGELGGLVKLSLFNYDFLLEETKYPTIVTPTGLKKFITGSGGAKKNEILLGVYRRWGIEFHDDNAADSYGLARVAEAIHTGKTQFAYERDVIAALTPFTERPHS